jgi:hypothetical protein
MLLAMRVLLASPRRAIGREEWAHRRRAECFERVRVSHGTTAFAISAIAFLIASALNGHQSGVTQVVSPTRRMSIAAQ